MGKANKPILLNLGCGEKILDGYVNVDNWGNPDVRADLNSFPYPWDDNSVDGVVMYHVLEHIPNWWECVQECARIIKPGGSLVVHVPDESSSSALTYRDHHHVFDVRSFDSISKGLRERSTTNAWFNSEPVLPLELSHYARVPFAEYNWLFRWPFTWLGTFCAAHMRNFIWEQRFTFTKVGT